MRARQAQEAAEKLRKKEQEKRYDEYCQKYPLAKQKKQYEEKCSKLTNEIQEKRIEIKAIALALLLSTVLMLIGKWGVSDGGLSAFCGVIVGLGGLGLLCALIWGIYRSNNEIRPLRKELKKVKKTLNEIYKYPPFQG